MSSTAAALIEFFVIGVATPLSAACVLPLYPAFIAYLASAGDGDRARSPAVLGLLVVAGVLTFMTLMGVLTIIVLGDGLRIVVEGVSPIAFTVMAVVGVVLSVGIAVLLATVVGSVALGTDLPDPAPAVSHSTATFEIGPSVGCTDNVVRLVHEGGEPVPPDELAVVVRLPEIGATARLVALPVAGTQLGSANVIGDTQNIVYDNCADGVIANGGSTWTAGTAIKFELNAGGGTVEPDDRERYAAEAARIAENHDPDDRV
jgi:cytochrome c biogenesis protein CcdA